MSSSAVPLYNTKNNDKTFYAWAVWALGSLFIFYKFALEVSPSIMSTELMREFSIAGTQMGNLASFYFYAYLLMQIPAGLLLDKFGVKRTTSLAIACCALGSLILSNAQLFSLACLGRFLTGAGAAFAVVSCFKLIALWFPTRRFALMSGLMMSIGMLGAVFGQAPLSSLVHVAGWRPALNSIGIVGVCFAVIFFFIIKDKKGASTTNSESSRSVCSNLNIIVRKKQNWLLSIYSGLSYAPVAVIGGLWGVPFIHQSFHLNTTLAATDISFVFIGFAFGAPVFGYLSDCFSSRKRFIYIGTLCAAAIISFVVYTSALSSLALSILFFLFGFFISSFMLSFTMIREVNPLCYAATSIAMMNTVNAILCAASEPFIGWLLDSGWRGKISHGVHIFSIHDFRLAMIAMPIYLVLACVVFMFVDETISDGQACSL